jgi:hypothetical protein
MQDLEFYQENKENEEVIKTTWNTKGFKIGDLVKGNSIQGLSKAEIIALETEEYTGFKNVRVRILENEIADYTDHLAWMNINELEFYEEPKNQQETKNSEAQSQDEVSEDIEYTTGQMIDILLANPDYKALCTNSDDEDHNSLVYSEVDYWFEWHDKWDYTQFFNLDLEMKDYKWKIEKPQDKQNKYHSSLSFSTAIEECLINDAVILCEDSNKKYAKQNNCTQGIFDIAYVTKEDIESLWTVFYK